MSLTRPRSLIALVALAGAAAVPALPQAAAPTPAVSLAEHCAGDATAASALVSDRAAAPARSTAAGIGIAVVVDPLVTPGIRTALLDTAAGLCTVDAFNLTVAAGLGDAEGIARLFASTAAMPWLGDVEVRDLAIDGDIVTLTTFGGRHNVTSDWSITVDALGVRDARFETISFGTGLEVADLHGLEGITSLPGHGRSWSRDAGGLLKINATILDDLEASLQDRDAAAAHAAEVAGLAPGDLLEGELDGQIIRYTLGYASPTAETVATGVEYADRLLYVRDGMQLIYDQFASWGAVDSWGSSARTFFGFSTVAPDEAGYINFNSGISAYCLACAFVGDFIEVHMELEFNELLSTPAFGYSYPDGNSSTLEVVGHEFTHTVQGGYGDGNVGLTNAFYEATATASQSLFHEAENSAQTGSIEYGDNANGCEGFEGGGTWIAAQANGPFLNGHTYDACYFWWTYMANHGGEGLIDLMEVLPGVKGQGSAQIDRHLLQLDLASPSGDGTLDLAYWAAAYTAGTAGDGYKIEDGSGDVHDWFALLKTATRSTDLAPGTSVAVTLKTGGTAGFRITADGTLAGLPVGAEAFVFKIVDGSIELVGPASVGAALLKGQILAVVAPSAATTAGSVSFV